MKPDLRERREDEASHWAARLEGGGMTDEDRAALAHWLAEDPERASVLAGYRQLSADVERCMTSARSGAAPRRRWWPALTAAAALVLIALWIERPESISTTLAERRTTALDDGSRLELNARTAVSVDFADARAGGHVRAIAGCRRISGLGRMRQPGGGARRSR